MIHVLSDPHTAVLLKYRDTAQPYSLKYKSWVFHRFERRYALQGLNAWSPQYILQEKK